MLEVAPSSRGHERVYSWNPLSLDSKVGSLSRSSRYASTSCRVRSDGILSNRVERARNRGPGAGFRGMQLRKWRPVGPDEAVLMAKDKPFVGDQSPRIALDASAPHGIRQSGLALVKGKKYTGRIYLRGTPGAKVRVSLIRGRGCERPADHFVCHTAGCVPEVSAQIHSAGRHH